VEIGGSQFEASTYKKLPRSYLKNKTGLVFVYVPIIPAMREAEEGGLWRDASSPSKKMCTLIPHTHTQKKI
jgi:hypothetical protein